MEYDNFLKSRSLDDLMKICGKSVMEYKRDASLYESSVGMWDQLWEKGGRELRIKLLDTGVKKFIRLECKTEERAGKPKRGWLYGEADLLVMRYRDKLHGFWMGSLRSYVSKFPVEVQVEKEISEGYFHREFFPNELRFYISVEGLMGMRHLEIGIPEELSVLVG